MRSGWKLWFGISVLLPREWAQIDAARAFAWRVRNLLHLHAGRRSDRLSFDQQELIAERDRATAPLAPGVEAFMSEYYQQARITLASAGKWCCSAPGRRPSAARAKRRSAAV